MNVSVVVPCYRSQTTLPPLVERLESALDELIAAGTIGAWEVILVVDGSPDDTAVTARRIVDDHDHVRMLEFRRNFGQHNALLAGLRDARYDVTVTIDDDLQHPPEEIGKLLAPLIGDARLDLVYGIPEEEEHGWARSSASRFVKRSLALAGVTNAEWVGAFRAFRTDLRDGFQTVNEPQLNIDVLLSWSTASVASAIVRMDRRADGRSGYTLPKLLRHTLNMLTGYGAVPLKLATWLGFLFGALGVVLLLIVVVRYFIGDTTVAGFTTTIAVIALFSGAQMVTIGIIGEYLGRQHFRSMRKPMYVLRERTEHESREQS